MQLPRSLVRRASFGALVALGGAAAFAGRSGDSSTSVGPDDPQAVLAQCAPSPDGRWLALSLDRNKIEGNQTLYLVELANSPKDVHFHWLGEGMFAPRAWGDDGTVRILERGDGRDEVRWIDPNTRLVRGVAPDKDWLARGLSQRPRPHDELSPALCEIAERESPREMIQLSPSGQLALVSHTLPHGRGQREIVLLDAQTARTVAGPWIGFGMSWDSWCSASDENWVKYFHDGVVELFDLDTSRSVPLDGAPMFSGTKWLDCERLLVLSQDGRGNSTVDLRDPTGKPTQRVFPPQD
jgi:hypothetical protein